MKIPDPAPVVQIGTEWCNTNGIRRNIRSTNSRNKEGDQSRAMGRVGVSELGPWIQPDNFHRERCRDVSGPTLRIRSNQAHDGGDAEARQSERSMYLEVLGEEVELLFSSSFHTALRKDHVGYWCDHGSGWESHLSCTRE